MLKCFYVYNEEYFEEECIVVFANNSNEALKLGYKDELYLYNILYYSY